MKEDTLTFETIRAQAGWIPAKMAIMISLPVNALLALASFHFEPNEQMSTAIMISYTLILVGTVALIWRWGRNQKKFQVTMLKDMIASQKKLIVRYGENGKRADWHKKRLMDSKGHLCKIKFHFDYPKTFEDAKRLVIDDLGKVVQKDPSFRLEEGKKQWTAAYIINEVTNETEWGKEYVKGFVNGINLMLEK